MDRPGAVDALERIVDNVSEVIRGKRQVVEASVLCMAANGHLLIEDAPGVGKTMLAKALARSIDASFKRVQATPDLLPSDVTGVAVFHQKTGNFEFIPGPIFANIVVVDEINRTTPRTQSALLEAMEERQVTAEGETRRVPSPFFVIATQNPIEFHGTYPLPEGQLDRFLIALTMGYTAAAEERDIVAEQLLEHPLERSNPVISLSEIEEIQAHVRETKIQPAVIEYAVEICRTTRSNPDLLLGAGPRGSLGLVRVSQARALMQGRDFVTPDDVKNVAPGVLAHRCVLKPTMRRGVPGAGRRIIHEVLEQVPVPVGD